MVYVYTATMSKEMSGEADKTSTDPQNSTVTMIRVWGGFERWMMI